MPRETTGRNVARDKYRWLRSWPQPKTQVTAAPMHSGKPVVMGLRAGMKLGPVLQRKLPQGLPLTLHRLRYPHRMG